MKLGKILALVLAFAMLLSVGAYAAGEDDEGTDAASATDAVPETQEEAGEEEVPATDMEQTADADDERAPADHIVLEGPTGAIRLQGAAAGSGEGVVIETVPGPEGEELGSFEVRLIDSKVQGDIVHGDEQRAMDLSLEGTELTGAVTGKAPAAPAEEDAEETEADGGEETAQGAEAAVPAAGTEDEEQAEKPETAQEAESPEEPQRPETAEDGQQAEEENEEQTAPEDAGAGIHMTLDGDSVWTVTGSSCLASLTLEEGAQVLPAGDGALAAYVNCAVDEKTGLYDAETGSYVSDLVPGVAYTQVVLEVTGQEEQPEAGTDLFAAFGVDTALVDGDYSVALESFLEAMGIQVEYDEQSGAITITDPNGVLDALRGEE